MKSRHVRGVVTALCMAAGLALAGCADERPYPTYNNGVAYSTPPCVNCAYGSAGNLHDYHDGQWHP